MLIGVPKEFILGKPGLPLYLRVYRHYWTKAFQSLFRRVQAMAHTLVTKNIVHAVQALPRLQSLFMSKPILF